MSADKPTQTLLDIDDILDEKDGSTHTLSSLVSSYTLTNEAKNALDRQSKQIRALIFSSDYTKAISYDNNYELQVGDDNNPGGEQFRFRSSSTTTTSVNKLLLLQFGLTDEQIKQAVTEKTTEYWIIERVKATKSPGRG